MTTQPDKSLHPTSRRRGSSAAPMPASQHFPAHLFPSWEQARPELVDLDANCGPLSLWMVAKAGISTLPRSPGHVASFRVKACGRFAWHSRLRMQSVKSKMVIAFLLWPSISFGGGHQRSLGLDGARPSEAGDLEMPVGCS